MSGISLAKTTYTALGRISSTTSCAASAAAAHYHHSVWAKAAAPKRTGASILLRTNYSSPFANILTQKRSYAAIPATAAKEGADVFTPPDISEYRQPINPTDDTGNRAYAYFMVGSLSVLSAVAAKSIVSDYLVHFSASADVVAMSKVEVEMNAIPEGKNVIIKWRGKPVFIRHRTADEIAEAREVNIAELRHQETDEQRTKQPEWLVMLGVCTHLGCVPIGEAGEYGGWFCPCHGSHYDISGRIRKGPAPLNLEIPEYVFSEDNKIVIG